MLRVTETLECVVSSFSVLVGVRGNEGQEWWFTSVYGPCRYRERNFRKSLQIYMGCVIRDDLLEVTSM